MTFALKGTAQSDLVNSKYMDVATDNTSNGGFIHKIDNRIAERIGTPYMNDTYAEGEIWLTQNRHFKAEMTYKFDELEGSVNVKSAVSGKELLLSPDQITECHIVLKNKIVVFKKIEAGHLDNTPLYQVIYEDNDMSMLKLPVKIVRRIDDKQPYGSGKVYEEYRSDYKYFLRSSKNTKYVEVKLKKLASQMPKKATIINKFFEAHPMDKLTDDDLTELMKKIH